MDGFANETNVYFGADLLISIADFFGDLILIYRCWLIWNGNYLVTILPLLTSVAGLSESINISLHELTQLTCRHAYPSLCR